MATEEEEAMLLRDSAEALPPPLPIIPRATTKRSYWAGKDLQGFISPLVILATVVVWQLVTMFKLVPTLALPEPVSVLHDLQTILTTGFAGKTLFDDIWSSTILISIGFVAAVLIGVPIGLLMGWSTSIFRVIDPYLQFIRPVPPLSYIPLLILWLGIGQLPKVVLILIGTLPVIIISTVSGVRSTPPQRIRVAQCMGANQFQLFFYTILPSALPEIFTGMRVGIGVSWGCLVAAELIAADQGLGWLVLYAGQQLQVGLVFVGIIAIGLLGYVMELIIRALERLIVPWKGQV